MYHRSSNLWTGLGTESRPRPCWRRKNWYSTLFGPSCFLTLVVVVSSMEQLQWTYRQYGMKLCETFFGPGQTETNAFSIDIPSLFIIRDSALVVHYVTCAEHISIALKLIFSRTLSFCSLPEMNSSPSTWSAISSSENILSSCLWNLFRRMSSNLHNHTPSQFEIEHVDLANRIYTVFIFLVAAIRSIPIMSKTLWRKKYKKNSRWQQQRTFSKWFSQIFK